MGTGNLWDNYNDDRVVATPERIPYTYIGNMHIIKDAGNTQIVTDINTYSTTRTASSFNLSGTILLFRKTSGYVTGNYKWRYFKCWNDGVNLSMHLVPAKNSSNVVGMYDLVSGRFFTNAGTGTFIAGPDTSCVVPISVSDGTTTNTYNISLTSPLQKISTYKDSIESDGTLTRGVGVKVLDGTESWTYTNNAIYANLVYANIPLYGLCSHFKYSTASVIAEMNDGEFIYNKSSGATNGNLSLKSNLFTDLTTAKSYLAAQYAAGTPVIVVYPLATPTETTITTPAINTAKGTNYVSIETDLAPSNTSFTYRKKTLS